jgi:hypothetical protein
MLGRSVRSSLLVLASVVGVIVTALLLPSWAHADANRLHFTFPRGSQTLDSTLVTVGVTTFDTTTVNTTEPWVAFAAASGDTAASLAVVNEVTGTMQTMDSLYVTMQGTQDTNPQSSSTRWVTIASAVGAAASVSGSQTFICKFPVKLNSSTSWVWWPQVRFILQGDTTTASVGFSTRSTLVWRRQ